MKPSQTFDPPGWRGVVVAGSDPGNQDQACVRDLGGATLAAVLDPKGGISGGREVVDAMARQIEAADVSPDLGALSDFLFLMDREIVEARLGGEASGSFVMMTPRTILAASAGDCEVWVRQDGTLRKMCGRRKLGGGFEFGTGGLMFDLHAFERPQTHWVALLSDGCSHVIDVHFLDALVKEGLDGESCLDRLVDRPNVVLRDSFSLLVHPGR